LSTAQHEPTSPVGPDEPIRLFGRPWVADPIFWLMLVGALVIGGSAAFVAGRDNSNLGTVGSLTSAVLAAVVWAALLGLLPALIRRTLTRRRQRDLLTRQPPSTEPGWYPDPTNLARYRWWNGTTWDAEVNPAPAPRTAGAAGIAGITVAAITVLGLWGIGLATATTTLSPTTAPAPDLSPLPLTDPQELADDLATMFPSPSASPPAPVEAFSEQLTMDLAKSYGKVTKKIGAMTKVRPAPGDTPRDFANKYTQAVREATGAYRYFNNLLEQVTSQEIIGPYPPLELLTDFDRAVGTYLATSAKVSGALVRCSESRLIEWCIKREQGIQGDLQTIQFEQVQAAIKALIDAREQ
jgi:hypothetical protein